MNGPDLLSFSEAAFLAAQTGWNSSSNWDARLESSAAAFESTVDELRIGNLGPEVAQMIREICGILKTIFTSHDKYVKFLDYHGEAAQDLLDILQKLLDHAPLQPQFRSLLYVALVRLCRKSELFPRSFTLYGVTNKEKDTLYPGAFGDVYKARYKGSPVCIKSVKVYRERDSEESFIRRKGIARKAFLREAVVWSQLSHANVVPFYGICFLKTDKLYLVSPLVPNGNVNQYLRYRPETNRYNLVYGVAAGMEYLHQNGVAHGDLKCDNVLVAEPEQALLTDFGFSYVTDNCGLNYLGLSSDHARGGTWVFEAPERVADHSRRRDEASDVFAFGMLCFEMFTSQSPEAPDIRHVHDNIVHHSKLPQQPIRYLSRGLTDNMWRLMMTCWSHEPSYRPTATDIKQQLPSRSRGHQAHYSGTTRPGFQSDDAAVTRALNHLCAL